MKRTLTTPTIIAAAALVLAPVASADHHEKGEKKPAKQQAQPTSKKEAKKEHKHPAKKAPEAKAHAEKKKCLDTEIQRLESALSNVGKAVDQRMGEQANKLAASQAELKKTKAECDALKKQLAAAQQNAKNVATEFQTFKASNEKQRQATMATLAKAHNSSKHAAKEIAELKKKNQHLEAHCKAACERLKAIVANLEKVEKDLSGAKK